MKKHSLKQYVCCGLMFAGGILLLDACSEAKSYKDTSLPPAERAALLLKEMTLEEKIGQMCQYVGPSHVEENEKKQVDLIVIVDDIKKFYEENLKKNK